VNRRWYAGLISSGVALNALVFGWLYRQRSRSRAAQATSDQSLSPAAPVPQPDRPVARPIVPPPSTPPPNDRDLVAPPEQELIVIVAPLSHYGINSNLLFTSFEIPASQR